MNDNLIPLNGQHIDLYGPTTIGAAGTTYGRGGALGVSGLQGAKYVALQAKFAYGAGGTNVTAYVQTSFDKGATWVDVACFQFTTAAATKLSALNTAIAPAAQAASPTDGALTANTVANGLLGDRLRVKTVSTGTYTGATSLEIDAQVKG